jgi:hypothetical protein
MIPFASVDTTALRWLRTSEAPVAYELRSGDDLIARLSRARHGGSLVHAETSEGSWTLKRVGFLHPRVTARKEGAPGDVAVLDIHWRRTSVRVGNGRSFAFERAGLAVPAWQFLTADGVRLVHIEPVRSGRSLVGGAVSVGPSGTRLAELPVLLLVGWYYIMQEWFEDEAVAAGEALLEASAGPSPPKQPGETQSP